MTDISEDDIRALRQQNDLTAFIKDQTRAAATRNTRRRATVLAHPDIAAKLTEPPMKFATPENWTGFVPPATLASGAINTSPVRPALLDLLHQAETRDSQPRGAVA
jgi:hypothetical protein